MSKYIYVKLIKKWGGFKVGDVVRFGTNKGEGRIKAGIGELVEKQRAVNDPPIKRVPRAETAMAPPAGENAAIPPKIDADAKAKARADAKKARAKAEKKGGKK